MWTCFRAATAAGAEVPVGGGANAENIKAVIRYLKETNWDSAVSIECYGSDENTRQSLAFMRGIV